MTEAERDQRLIRIEELLSVLVDRQTVKDFYQVEEFARLVGKASFTVREWARLGRIHAEKRRSGRGTSSGWVISHQEYAAVSTGRPASRKESLTEHRADRRLLLVREQVAVTVGASPRSGAPSSRR